MQIRVFNYGERLIDRLDFEELALKSLDPSLGPKITSPRTAGRDVQQPQVYPHFFVCSLEPDLAHASDSVNLPTAYNHVPLT